MVSMLAMTQEGQPQTHRSIVLCARYREKSLFTTHQSSVFRIIHDDLGPKCLKKRRAQELTQANQAVQMQKAAENVFEE